MKTNSKNKIFLGKLTEVRLVALMFHTSSCNIGASTNTNMTHSVFFNLSNHASKSWTSVQKEYIKKLFQSLGKEAENIYIVDIPFPAIDPKATPFDIEKLVEDTFQKFYDYYDSHTDGIVLHVMGEMGFTYQAVAKALKEGLPVVHSTTERKTQEVTNEDGTTTKTSVFEFVQFRPY